MPTAAKLVAALAVALVGALAARAYAPHLPGETVPGLFLPICAGLGALTGWRVVGPAVGRGWQFAAATGLRGVFVLLLLALALFSVREMLLRAMDLRYRGVMDALLGVFDIAWHYMIEMADPLFAGTVVLGGVLAGCLAEWAARRWK